MYDFNLCYRPCRIEYTPLCYRLGTDGSTRTVTQIEISHELMMSQQTVFTRLEKYIKNKYPTFLKLLLLNLGYDCETVLETLNEDEILKIESEINLNRDAYKELLKNTIYENQIGEFKFLIGHKTLILKIPEHVRSRLASVKENTQLPTLDSDALKLDLLAKIQNRINSRKLNCVISNEHIESVSVSQTDGAKFAVKCLFCDAKILCSFKKGWQISNFFNHISGHNSKNTDSLEDSSTKQPPQEPLQITQNPRENRCSFQRGNPSIISEVESVLNNVDASANVSFIKNYSFIQFFFQFSIKLSS